MSKVLLCDANFCVLPIVKSIMKKKYHLSVVGALLDDPAHKIADNSIPINYSDINALEKHILENNYTYLIPGCNDRSYLSLSKIAEKFNYPGFDKYETVLDIHYKDRFRSIAEKFDYPVPKAVNKYEDIKKLKFPIMIKPIDSFSGKGANKVQDIQDAKKYWDEAREYSPTENVVAEEFIEGELYSHSAFIKDKKIVIDFFVNEYCTVYPYQVNSSSISTQLSENIQLKLREWVEKFAQDLNLVDGLIHTQFIANEDMFFLIEVARRCPGDLYSELIKKSTGIDYAELYSIPFIGEALPSEIKKDKLKFISRHTVSVDKECIFISSGVNLDCKKIENVQLKYSGERMKEAPFDKSGIYFIEHKNINNMEILTRNLKDYVYVESLDIPKKD